MYEKGYQKPKDNAGKVLLLAFLVMVGIMLYNLYYGYDSNKKIGEYIPDFSVTSTVQPNTTSQAVSQTTNNNMQSDIVINMPESTPSVDARLPYLELRVDDNYTSISQHTISISTLEHKSQEHLAQINAMQESYASLEASYIALESTLTHHISITPTPTQTPNRGQNKEVIAVSGLVSSSILFVSLLIGIVGNAIVNKYRQTSLNQSKPAETSPRPASNQLQLVQNQYQTSSETSRPVEKIDGLTTRQSEKLTEARNKIRSKTGIMDRFGVPHLSADFSDNEINVIRHLVERHGFSRNLIIDALAGGKMRSDYLEAFRSIFD